MPPVIDLSQWNDLMARLTRFVGPDMPPVLRYVAGRVGAKAEQLAGIAPPPSGKPLAKYYDRERADGTTYKSKFKSAKQQRKVMALASEGKIPYKRSGKLVQSITSAVTEATTTSATVAVGSNRPEAPYVLGKAAQSHYHAGTWVPIEDALLRGEDQLIATAGNALFQQAKQRLGGR